jgi:hypothetical protein
MKKRLPKEFKAAFPATDLWTSRAKAFLSQKWAARAAELGHPVPTDLSGACKFASLFAQALFGGRIRGNWYHQFNELPSEEILDLTSGSAGSDDYTHDPIFWRNTEHIQSLNSCTARVESWVMEFQKKYAETIQNGNSRNR